MRKVIYNRYRFKDVLMYLTALSLIADFACMWKLVNHSVIGNIPVGILSGVLCLIQIVLEPRFLMPARKQIQLVFIGAALLFYILLTRYNIASFIKGYFAVFVCYYLYTNYLFTTKRILRFFKAFSNIICFISICSLFFWLFGSVLHIMPGRTGTTYYWASEDLPTYTYFHLYYENPIQNAGQSIARNVGVFTEAPGYSSILTYALLIEFGIKNSDKSRTRWMRIGLLFCTMITSFSTKGIIAALLLFYLDFVLAKTSNKYIKLMKVVSSACLILVVAYVGFSLASARLNTGSGAMRIDDIQSEIKAWLESPLWGIGYENDEAIWKYQTVIRDSGGLSMGITVILAYGGILFLALYVIPVFITHKSPFFRKHKKIWILVIALLAYNLFISNCGYYNLFIFILAAGYTIPLVAPIEIDSICKIG